MSQITAQTTASEIGAVTTLTGNTGVATPDGSGNINVIDSQGTAVFTGASHTLTHTYTDANNNTLIGNGSGSSLAGALSNTSVGYITLNQLTSGVGNTAMGSGAASGITTGDSNCFFGQNSGILLTTTNNNSGYGYRSLGALVTGTNNIGLGVQAGLNYTSSESNNIMIGHLGVVTESGVTRIGTPGTQTSCYVAGINAVNVGSVATVVTESGSQLGTAVITAGTGISVTPGANSITIAATEIGAVTTLTGDTGGPVAPTGGNINVQGSTNITVVGNPGTSTLNVNLNNTINLPETNAGGTQGVLYMGGIRFLYESCPSQGNNGVFLGKNAGNFSITGDDNVGIGGETGNQLTDGQFNTMVGVGAGESFTHASYNSLFGFNAGSDYSNNESSNIIIGYENFGTAGENNTLRIGNATGTSEGNLSAAYICGISGVNVGSVATVVTEAGNQLGTAVITAGTGISVGTSANTITISATGTTTLTYKAISSGPYTVLPTDDYLGVTSSSTGISILLPNSGSVGGTITVKDTSGNSSTFNITVTTVGGAVLIDGATTFVMNANYQAANFIWNGTSYEVF